MKQKNYSTTPPKIGPRHKANTCLSLLCALLATALAPPSLPAQNDVLTYHNDNARTGQNLSETNLTSANVNTNTFGLLFTCPVDGKVYAQPLYMAALAITNEGTHNVVFVATENDSVYAFDADDNTGSNATPLWQVSFINPAAGVTTVPSADVNSGDLSPVIGITSTPVIDSASLTLYVEAKTKEVSAAATNYVHRLHALDLGSGAEKFGGPVVIQPVAPGTGDGNDGAGNVPFNGLRQLNRPGLLLLNDVVYVAYASHGDNGPYHGWVLGFNAQTLQPQGVFISTPNGGLGGFWEGGDGPAADDYGNLYLISGNGTFDGTNNNDYADSYIKLTPSDTNLDLVDYFTPFNQQTLSAVDLDVGSGGLVLLPDAAGSSTHPHLAVGAGKDGIIHLVDRDNFGQFNDSDNNQIVQSVPAINASFGTPAYFNNTLYYIANNDTLKAFSCSNALLGTNPASASSTVFANLGDSPSISANGTINGIVWALQDDSLAILHAFDATNVALELYNSQQAGGRDEIGLAVKFAVPTVANGKVYVGAASCLAVFGGGTWNALPGISPEGGVFTNQVTVTLTPNSPGAQIYYTLDGATPTLASDLYSADLTLTNTTIVLAVAVAPDASESAVAAALFIAASSDTAVAGFGGGGSGWTLNGGAVVTNDVLTLTDGTYEEARSAFFNSSQPITAFNAQFVYQSDAGADGTAFVVQNAAAGASALGDWGGCLGYCGITPSAAVEFNLFSGAGGTGTAYATNGATGTYASTLPLILGSGDPIWVTLNYNGVNLAENLFDLVTEETYSTNYAANLPLAAGGNTAFIGFTAGTGGLTSVQTVTDFIFSLNNPPADTPVITPNGAIFTNNIVVTLSTATAGAQIYYTLDGTKPTVFSTPYSGPFLLTNTAALNALTIASGLTNSQVAFAFFGDVAAPFTVAGFGGNGSGWTLNGGVEASNDVLTLTDGMTDEARTAFFDTAEVITNFSARFVYQSAGGADGAAFVIQNAAAGAGALGAGGDCLGYCGISPSAAIEFDLYSGTGGPGTRFATNGVTEGYTSTLPLNLGSGDPIWVVLNYDGSVLSEHLVDQNNGHTFDAAYAADLPTAVGGNAAFIGFTAGTGGAVSVQQVGDFIFTLNNPPAATPIITPNGAIFTNSIVVALSTPAPGAQIYFTLDGTTPTTNSTLYTAPFTLTDTAAVKAVTVAPGLANSEAAFSFFGDVSVAVSVAGFGGNGFDWTLNGGAVVSNDVITLTDGMGDEARSAFFDTIQVITNFIARFVYQSTGGADGTAFVLQNEGASALGAGGACLGYCDISPSAAVEFNLYSGQGGTGTRFATDGVTEGYTSTLPLDLASGDPIWVVLNYNGSVLNEHLVDQNNGNTFDAAYSVNLCEAVGGSSTAGVGFTAGDGGVSSIQTVTGFTFGPNGPAPVLSAVTTGNCITISWTSSPLNYVLELTTDLAPPATWLEAPQTPIVSAGQTTVAIPVGPTNTFYRLRVP
jgi:hypothetical protein